MSKNYNYRLAIFRSFDILNQSFMKRTILFLCVFIGNYVSLAQTPTLQQKLYYTCKVWGFVKYYHSNVSTCNVNWDSVLVSILPVVENAVNDSEFNDALDTMLAAAGPMALSTTYFPDTLPANLKFNRNFSWISTSLLRNDVRVQMDTIKNNFRPHSECWVGNNTFTTSYNGWLVLPYDNPDLNVNTITSYPGENQRLLMLFKYWNVVSYFYPYTYVLDVPWDTTLYNYVIPVANAGTAYSLYLLYLKMVTNLNDAHVYGMTFNQDDWGPLGGYFAHLRLQYIDSQYVVVNSLVSGINVGDIIVSVNGLSGAQWEDSLKPYCSSGNMAVFRRSVGQDMISSQDGEHLAMVVKDSTGADHTMTVPTIYYNSDPSFFNGYFYPADSLNTIHWTTLPCNIGYVNIANIQSSEVPGMYNTLQNKSAIIFDLRNYPNGSEVDIINLLYPSSLMFAKTTVPDVTYPGTYFWTYDSLGVNGNLTPYHGKILVLMNEQTQSAAEYTCMALAAIGAIKVGSQTAGADGNISYWNLSQDLYTGFTTLGEFYPNGDSVQRIGIVPDTIVYPTVAGIRHGVDEVLNKALMIAGCNLASPVIVSANMPVVNVFPNPANDIVHVEATNTGRNKVTIEILDVTGRVLLERTLAANGQNVIEDFDIAKLSPGVYFVRTYVGACQHIFKLTKD